MENKNYFQILFDVNVSDKIEKKNNLSYVSWSYAWAEVKKRFPDATYTVYENNQGWNYFTDGRTCWVKTGMTVNGIEHIEMLPVMDFKNRSILLENVTSMDVNKTIQRSLTKAAARHGLGLYVYAGEDLPECDQTEEKTAQEKVVPSKEKVPPKSVSSTGGKVPALSEEMKYLSTELGYIANEKNTSMESIKATFEVCRKVAIKSGICPDKKVTEYTKDELIAALNFMMKSMEKAG